MSQKIAILLNQNARKVNSRSVQLLKSTAPHADFFITKTLAEANAALKQIARNGYDLFFTGGGDGTVCHAVTRLSELCQGRHQPDIGILPLGTGNAIASFLESPSLDQCISAAPGALRDPLSFVSARGDMGEHKAAFGGFGWDAFILDHYYRWREICKKYKILRPFGEGLHAYLISGLGWAIPSMLLNPPKWQIKLSNGDVEGYRVNFDGEIVQRFAPHETIYEGQAQLLSFGTCPLFGFRLKGLPFAALRSDRMHIRLGDFSSITPALQLSKLWKGTLRHERLWDFLVQNFKVELDRPAAVQMGGDIIGHMESLEVNMSDPSMMLRYAPAHGMRLPHHPSQRVA